jgi:hypothetical protein
MLCLSCTSLTFLQPVRNDNPHSHTTGLDTFSFRHTTSFLCFQIDHMVHANTTLLSSLSWPIILNIFSLTETVKSRACIMLLQSPSYCQHSVLFWQEKNKCKLSSLPASHRTQLLGQSTPRSCNQTLVGKQFQQTCQIFFLSWVPLWIAI